MKKHKDKFTTKVKKNVAATKTIFAGSLVGGVALLLIGTQFAPDRDLIPASQLSTTQQFPSMHGGTIEITSQEMDWEKHIMKIDIQASDELAMKNLDTSVFIQKDEGSSVQIIPTIDNKATIFIKNLHKNFQVLSLAFEDKGLRTNDVDTQVFDDTQSAKSSEEETTTAEEDNTVYFYISENSKYLKSVKNEIKVKSQKEYAVDTVQSEISFQNSQIEKVKNGIKKLEELQTRNKQEIEELTKQNSYLTGSQLDKNQQQIIDLQSEIQTSQNQAEDAEKSIVELDKKIEKMQQQISDIQSGKYKFPLDIKTQKLK